MTGGRFTTDDLPRRQTLQSRFESRGLSGVRENYQIRENSRPNAPAPHTPHGRPFGLSDAISVIKDFRNPPNGYQVPRERVYDYDGGNQASRGPLGARDDRPANPVAKLLKKVGILANNRKNVRLTIRRKYYISQLSICHPMKKCNMPKMLWVMPRGITRTLKASTVPASSLLLRGHNLYSISQSHPH